ncbi:AraC family transcriptional regulator [Spiribacter salinus M19-40]|jgi:transcriptional regulator GlxA family with amidase domain|uniref:AraC family transcriptional regulator n=1 Tax=Spiribacter salinus M19-40 TaxID=1260251 RepID=R4VKY2_9GAMM|nr:GlxA family transcriptional regulator [Spiribacter salinus]AGM40273.1 AraC family transcriptional regulator [Spiribacter salinus M19-40]
MSEEQGPYRVAFLMVPGYSQLAFSSAIEPLRMANQLSDRTLYETLLVSLDGRPVSASNQVRTAVDAAAGSEPPVDLVIVCGGVDIEQQSSRELLGWLRRLARRHTALGAVCTGGFLLAQAGVMEGYRCTLHWEHISGIYETLQFPGTVFASELFVLDRDRYTSSGGVAPLDMMLNLITRQQGIELAEAISEEFLHERIREFSERQRVPLRVRLGTSQPKLVEVVTLMEANIHEPLSLDELAAHAATSRRQLERLFRRYLGCTPTRYYLELRLIRARQLLLQTDMPITDIAMACGFVSPPHFTKCYHDRHGHSPSAERRARRDRLSAGPPAITPAAGTDF